MAIYHLSAQVIKRSTGRSSVAAAAYRSGEKIEDERTGLIHDYTRKNGIEYKEIMAPENSPEWVKDRNKLWNEIEKIEDTSTRRDSAQTAREINVALPKELNNEQQIELIRSFVKDNFVDRGMIADVAVHGTATENPHAHIMLTTREITLDGFGKKNREWNDKELLDQWREKWASYSNKALEKAGREERIDHRSLKDQGINREAQIHVGYAAKALEKKGVETDRECINQDIKEVNKKLKEIKDEKVVLLGEYKKVREEKKKADFYWKQYSSQEKDVLLKAQEVLNKFATLENIKNGYRFIDKKIDFWSDLHSKLTKKMNPYDEADKILSKLKNLREEYKDSPMFSKERKELKESISEFEAKFKKQTEYLQKYSKDDLSSESKFEKAYSKLKEDEIFKRAKYNNVIKNWSDKKELLFKAENILKENELRKLIKAYPEYQQFKNGINPVSASYINEVNRIMHKKLSFDEIINIGDKSANIVKESNRLVIAEKNLEEYDKLIELSNKHEKAIGSFIRLVSNKADLEYKELQQKISNVKSNLEKCHVNDREDFDIQKGKLKQQIEELPRSFTTHELKNKERELNNISYQLYRQEEKYKKAASLIVELKENRDNIKGISSLLHDNKEVKQKIQSLEESFKKCNVGNEKDFERNLYSTMNNIQQKKNDIAEQKKDLSKNLDLSGVCNLSVVAKNAAIELKNKMFINSHYNSQEFRKVVNQNELGAREGNEANPGRNYDFNRRIGGVPTQGDRHIESTSNSFVRYNESLQGTSRTKQQGNNGIVQSTGREDKRIDKDYPGDILETATRGIKESTGFNEKQPDGIDSTSKVNDGKTSTEDRASIFTKNSNNLFNSRFKSYLSAGIQDSSKLNKELLRQIDESKNEVDKIDDTKEYKTKEKVKSNDRER